eukprot:TRINITY_DN5706_c0_g1_i1.p1 TRINITY_DN5706_c0_g1~~TRINITY_DN5706_c0_g1_i1.p1  ORF type:complete len:207 (+),score=6.30 TRINITY_DN5706_c0_g1_i1:57-677(+)
MECEDAEQLHSRLNERCQLQALVPALMLTITYTLDAGMIDLEALNVCDGWKGYRLSGGDEQFEWSCGECHNIHQTCGASDTAVSMFKVLNYAATSLFGAGLALAFTFLANFAKMPRTCLKQYVLTVGWLIDGLDKVIYGACAIWVLAMIVQASLVLKPGEFGLISFFGTVCLTLVIGLKLWLRKTRFDAMAADRNELAPTVTSTKE